MPRPMLPCTALLRLTPTQTQICTVELLRLIPTQTQICTVELPLRIPIRQCRPVPFNKAVTLIALHLLLLLNFITRRLLRLLLLLWLPQANTKHIGHHRITTTSELLHLRPQPRCITCRDSLHQLHKTMHLLLHLPRHHRIVFSINRTALFLLALLTSLM
jgi:hypothetical protein